MIGWPPGAGSGAAVTAASFTAFGAPLVLTSPGGASLTVPAILRRNGVVVEGDHGGSVGSRPTVALRRVDFAGRPTGWTFVAGGKVWEITSAEADGGGLGDAAPTPGDDDGGEWLCLVREVAA